MTQIVFPWPDSRLHGHAKGHWRIKATATKEARSSAFWRAKHAGVKKAPSAILRFTFHPPDKRRRDIQNMPGMCKAMIDGIADAMGCDDHRFRPQFPDQFSTTTPGGSVVVEIIPGVVEIEHRGVIT